MPTGRMLNPLILIKTWAYKLQIKEKDVYIGEMYATYPLKPKAKSWHCISWLWPMTGTLDSWWKFVPQTQFMLFENSSMHKEVIAWTSFDAHMHTQTLNSHFDNYVELSTSGLDIYPLTTKHNTSKHKLQTNFDILTFLITGIWNFRTTLRLTLENICPAMHVEVTLRTCVLRGPPNLDLWVADLGFANTHHPIIMIICFKLFCNPSKNKLDIDRINLDRHTDWRTYIHQTIPSWWSFVSNYFVILQRIS
jgi:hypothetical protein